MKLRHFLNRVTGELKRTRHRLNELEAGKHEPVAIVGMSCRLPGGIRDQHDLWGVLTTGTDVISAFPADRGWDLDRLFEPDPDQAGTCYTREGGFLLDAGGFDAGF